MVEEEEREEVGEGTLRRETGGEQQARRRDFEDSLGSSFHISVDSYRYAPLLIGTGSFTNGTGELDFEFPLEFELFVVSDCSARGEDFRARRGERERRRFLGESENGSSKREERKLGVSVWGRL